MIQSDTIKPLSDSTNGVPSDSMAKLDTLAEIDSSQILDTVKAIIQAPRGHIGIPHPPLPQTDVWVFGVLLFLFMLLIISISKSSNAISNSIKTIFQTKERNSLFGKSTINTFRFRFFLLVFSIGVISLYAYLYFLSPGTSFSIVKYSYFFLSTSCFFGLKSVLIDILGYVFFDPKFLKPAKESYFNIMSLFGLTLFPILIFQIYIPFNIESILHTISFGILVLTYLFVLIKLFQIFFHKIVASFYILLYLCTLEFLPLFALYLAYNLIV